MKSDKVKLFMNLAGQRVAEPISASSPERRQLGAQLLLSEVLEYVIKGLGVVPEINGQPLTDPEAVRYRAQNQADAEQMLDGLADVAYTMYWNSLAFGLPLEPGFELVCDNNLEKFVRLENWRGPARTLAREEWHCGKQVSWPAEVATVEVLEVDGAFFAVGKDARGKVRKPSTYKSVDLSALMVEHAAA